VEEELTVTSVMNVPSESVYVLVVVLVLVEVPPSAHDPSPVEPVR